MVGNTIGCHAIPRKYNAIAWLRDIQATFESYHQKWLVTRNYPTMMDNSDVLVKAHAWRPGSCKAQMNFGDSQGISCFWCLSVLFPQTFGRLFKLFISTYHPDMADSAPRSARSPANVKCEHVTLNRVARQLTRAYNIFDVWHLSQLWWDNIWWFPEIGVPLNHHFLQGCSITNHPAMGVALF